jgi:hypothetical protein
MLRSRILISIPGLVIVTMAKRRPLTRRRRMWAASKPHVPRKIPGKLKIARIPRLHTVAGICSAKEGATRACRVQGPTSVS